MGIQLSPSAQEELRRKSEEVVKRGPPRETSVVQALRMPAFLTVVWLVCLLFTCTVLGAFLSQDRVGESPWQVMWLLIVILTGLPLILPLRPAVRFLQRAILANLILVSLLVFLVPTTGQVVQQYGHWAVHWLNKSQGYSLTFATVEGVADITHWALRKLHTEFGIGTWKDEFGEDFGRIRSRRRGTQRALAQPAPGDDPDRLPVDLSDSGEWRSRIREELARTPDAAQILAMEESVKKAINSERSKGGLPPLAASPDLAAVARSHSQNMVTQDFTSHVDPEGLDARARVHKAGLKVTHVEEVLAQVDGYGDKGRELFKGFMSLEADRMHLLNPEGDPEGLTAGVGVACEGPHCRATLLLAY